MKVKCVNSKNRPNEIPINKWVEEKKTYTVIDVVKCNSQNGTLAYILEEIDISGYAPFVGFASYRFSTILPEVVIESLELQELNS